MVLQDLGDDSTVRDWYRISVLYTGQDTLARNKKTRPSCNPPKRIITQSWIGVMTLMRGDERDRKSIYDVTKCSLPCSVNIDLFRPADQNKFRPGKRYFVPWSPQGLLITSLFLSKIMRSKGTNRAEVLCNP